MGTFCTWNPPFLNFRFSSLVRTGRIIFTPDTELKDELKNTAIVITCYDRNGEEVKRVTSADDGDIEDDENGNGNGNENQSQGGGDDLGDGD